MVASQDMSVIFFNLCHIISEAIEEQETDGLKERYSHQDELEHAQGMTACWQREVGEMYNLALNHFYLT